MTQRSSIGSPPSTEVAAHRWVSRGDAKGSVAEIEAAACSIFTARLTIDITPELRGRIKVAAFKRGSTVTNLLRILLEREFGQDPDAT